MNVRDFLICISVPCSVAVFLFGALREDLRDATQVQREAIAQESTNMRGEVRDLMREVAELNRRVLLAEANEAVGTSLMQSRLSDFFVQVRADLRHIETVDPSEPSGGPEEPPLRAADVINPEVYPELFAFSIQIVMRDLGKTEAQARAFVEAALSDPLSQEGDQLANLLMTN